MSASVTSSTAELPEKFQRLTKEYLRVKDMCKVLRDGVNSERAKSEKLEYNLKEKEAQYRRLASEKEAIEFHNQQLTKRIELLMDELEKKPPVTKKKKLKPNEINVEELYNKIKILEDELCNKLHLNEELINKISDLESRESSLVADLEKQKELVEEIKFVRKMTPIITSLAAAQTNGHGAKNGCSDSPIMYEAVAEKPVPNDCNNLFLEENKNEEAKHGLVAKLDAEVQVDFEPNNNASSSPSPDKSAAELTSKVEEITRLRENIRRLEDIKEKQSLDISLLKKKLEMTGKGPAGIDSAEEATKLARVRIREVVGEKEAAENSARYFMKEIKSLQHNVRDLHENKIYLQGRINELEGLNAEINDELSSVRKSYDAQLSQMSDLVIELNKKIQTADAPPAKQEPIATTRSIRSLFGK